MSGGRGHPPAGHDKGPPRMWRRILRAVLRGEEVGRIEEWLDEMYVSRREEAPGTENAWYRRQVMGFVLRLPQFAGSRGEYGERHAGVTDSLRHDVRFALRQGARQPVYALLVVVIVGLGIGAATAIFGMVRAVVLEPLPYPEPDRLVAVLEITPDGRDFVTTSEPNFLDFQEQNRTFQGMAAWRASPVEGRLGDDAVQLQAVFATPGLFELLGGEPILGRVFAATEADATAEPVVVLSHRLWRDGFGAARDVIATSLLIDGVSHEVIGVMGEGWEPMVGTDVWLPQPLRPFTGRDDHELRALGRLLDGIPIGVAKTDLMRIQRDLGERYPDSNGAWGVDLRPLKTMVVGEERLLAGWVLLGAVGLLLLLACASVSNLLVARATGRRREIGIRTALGASRARLLRQLGAESVVLSAAGCAVGIMIAYATIPVLQALAPPGTPRIGDARIDVLVLLFSAAAASAAGLLFCIAPAIQTLGTSVRASLAQDDRSVTGSGERLRAALVVVQVAVAFTLVTGVALLGSTFVRLQAEDPGLALEQTLAVPLTMPGSRYDEEDRLRVLAEIEERVRVIPGVASVGAVNVQPFVEAGTVNVLSVEGKSFAPGENPFARWRAVTHSYLDAAGIRVMHGRNFNSNDRGLGSGDAAVAIVTETMARDIWGSPDAALGRRIAMSVNSENWMRVVGVTEDVTDIQLAEGEVPQFFFIHGGWWPLMTLVIRTDFDATTLASAIRSAVHDVDADLPVPLVETVADGIQREFAGPRFNFVLMLVFGTVALALAFAGVYGVTQLAVSRRVREIGIRRALGATTSDTASLVVGMSAKLTITGIAVGVVLVIAGARTLDALLYGTSPLEPLVLAGVAALLVGAALLAASVPARRATRVDPAVVLRAD